MSGTLPDARSHARNGAALVALVLLVVSCSAQSSGDERSADPTPHDTATSKSDEPAGGASVPADRESVRRSAVPVDRDTERSAEAGLKRYFNASARALRTKSKGKRVSGTAMGPALDAAQSRAAEFEDNGWRQVGVAKVVRTTVIADHRDDDPPRMTVAACVDSSNVDVVDRAGNSVQHDSGPSRTLTLFYLVQRDGDWVVERQGFPDDPTC